ncbi:thioesterase [Halarcobacter mediterraneus]|uniref:Thioesterase n=1 Tax=Halarcobacter mediterraneus TaxID=2023153 RepID=A0A4Q1AV55_9BACT|nr:YiiD C-terminal domain-containing protein [Halarcobacter mediterraneus]RXK13905.1 thioesterase [Halarcobacter mediterraneus]
MLVELENKLHDEIPLTKFMQLKINKITKKHLITSAPLKPNINDKLTGFAGSLSTIVTISAWSVCYLKVKEIVGLENSMIAIIKSNISYRAPVTKDFTCITTLPDEKEIYKLKEKLELKKSASIRIKSQIIEKETVCVDFEGIYVIKI